MKTPPRHRFIKIELQQLAAIYRIPLGELEWLCRERGIHPEQLTLAEGERLIYQTYGERSFRFYKPKPPN